MQLQELDKVLQVICAGDVADDARFAQRDLRQALIGSGIFKVQQKQRLLRWIIRAVGRYHWIHLGTYLSGVDSFMP
ncbi:hypothetical protein ACLS0R_04615 [Comamonas jiangduensis]|uniref:hypothetical protein n=1 Tax=Comamonas jiangduensis TaxID=1194168 RepID=UPI001FE269A8|nr:hypothetical protein [Comamonas jiangduensis]